MDVNKALKGKYVFRRKYGNTMAYFFEYLQLTDEVLEVLKGKNAEISADGDFFVLYLEENKK